MVAICLVSTGVPGMYFISDKDEEEDEEDEEEDEESSIVMEMMLFWRSRFFVHGLAP
jgi:hypothetical protein